MIAVLAEAFCMLDKNGSVRKMLSYIWHNAALEC